MRGDRPPSGRRPSPTRSPSMRSGDQEEWTLAGARQRAREAGAGRRRAGAAPRMRSRPNSRSCSSYLGYAQLAARECREAERLVAGAPRPTMPRSPIRSAGRLSQDDLPGAITNSRRRRGPPMSTSTSTSAMPISPPAARSGALPGAHRGLCQRGGGADQPRSTRAPRVPTLMQEIPPSSTSLTCGHGGGWLSPDRDDLRLQ